jgi:site-specific recombinase XerD
LNPRDLAVTALAGKTFATSCQKFYQNNSLDEIVDRFKDFLIVGRNLADSTVKSQIRNIKLALISIEKHLDSITTEDIRSYLKKYEGNTKGNRLKALKRFFRDFLGSNKVQKLFFVFLLQTTINILKNSNRLYTLNISGWE